MRLFISYARVDKPFCEQIVGTLEVHDVWYDRRLHAGQKWWEEIQRRVQWCEGFVYLLSPDSISSKYCQQEFALAQQHGKHIFPVLIHPRTPLPPMLEHLQYADLSHGLTPDAVKVLLNSIYIAERQQSPARQPLKASAMIGATVPPPLDNDPVQIISEAAEALDSGDYDHAVFLLKQAREYKYNLKFVKLEAMLQEAEAALEQQTYLREAEREYRPIVTLVRHTRTRRMGCEAFQQFRQQFPDYDPEHVALVCATSIMPMLEWCDITEGSVKIDLERKHILYHVAPFRISKYPITNAQFQMFVTAEDGYSQMRWWDGSEAAATWRREHPEPLPSRFQWGDHPRTNVCWYEAVAFCRWLSTQTGLDIMLPEEQDWQRAAQSDDGRTYPWGANFDRQRCNTRESMLRTTTPVNRYPNGASPFGVCDLAGNVWEWCGNALGDNGRAITDNSVYAVRGGSFISVAQRARASFRFLLNPTYRYASIGFRVMCV